jgi:hypothetical protein
VSGDQYRWQLIALKVFAVIDDRKWFNAGNVEFLESAEHVVLTLCHVKERFLDGDYVILKVGESNGVPGETLWQSRNVFFGPVFQWQMPRQIQQCWFCRGSRDA